MPAAGFDPFKVGGESLKRFGLPAVPEDPRVRERYLRIFKQVRHKLAFVVPEIRVEGRFRIGNTKLNPANPPLVSSGFSCFAQAPSARAQESASRAGTYLFMATPVGGQLAGSRPLPARSSVE